MSSTTLSTPAPRDRNDFHIAILCALWSEAECVIDALDRRWKDKRYDPPSNDDNSYTLGAIGEHNVVIVHMPGMGAARAASAAGPLRLSYPNVKLALVVGVCGGMPTGAEDEEILLGDVVISKALVEYDFGKQYPEGFERRTDVLNTLAAPSDKILGLLTKLETRQHKEDLRTRTIELLSTIQQKSPEVKYPGSEHDILYPPSYTHKHHKPEQCHTCEKTDEVCQDALRLDCGALGCESSGRVPRRPVLDPSTTQPMIHIGTMGCANTVMKSGHHRDTLARKEGIIAVEMEGAGVWRHGQSIVIKGVCDYADSHKMKTWQRYAAATAAACTKAFLLEWWAPEKRYNHSDPVNTSAEIPKRQGAKTLSDREYVFRPMGYVPPGGRRRASRCENEPSEQLQSGGRQSLRPSRHFTEDSYNEPVATYNRKNNTDLPSKHERSWKYYLQSLKFDEMNERERSIQDNSKGTCEWLFNSSEYKQWIQEKGIFIVRGNPGCGKSTLIKYTLAQQQPRAAQDGSRALNISFFFYSSGMELESSMKGMLRSLLCQLVETDEDLREPFRDLCHKIFSARRGKKGDLVWEMHDLQATFEDLLVQTSTRHSVKIFVDAINECRDRDHEDLIQFFHSLVSPTSAYVTKIGIFVTSRKDAVIQVGRNITIHLEDKNKEDIRSFLTEQLQRLDETQEARDKLKTFLEEEASGSFLWLVLVMPRIRRSSGRGDNMSSIKRDISKCPKELSELYSELLKDIDETKSGEINALFQWICFATRPLSIREFRIAFTIHTSEVLSSMEEYIHEDSLNYIADGGKLRTKVTHLSQGLVDFSSTDPADEYALMRFYHGSIQDFMREKGLDIIRPKTRHAGDLTEAASAQLTNTCLRFLAAKDVRDAMLDGNTDYLNRYAFFTYARDHWYEHATEAENNGTADLVDWTLHTGLSAWIHIQRHSKKGNHSHFVEGTQPIHIAARHGLATLASKLLGDKGINEVSGTQSAAETRMGSPVPTHSGRSGTESPRSPRSNRSLGIGRRPGAGGLQLDMAKPSAGSRSRKIAVANSGKARSQGGKSKSVSPAPVNTAQRDSLLSTKRKQCADMIDFCDARGATPLMLAASAGKLVMVELLCELGADIHSQNEMTWTPLLMASIQGHVDVVECLLKRKADIETRTASESGFKLWGASSDESAWEQLFEYLWENGANLHFALDGGWTPLGAASFHGRLAVVECLLNNGANVRTANEAGCTPLCAASDKGHLNVVQYLLEHGADADIHTRNKNGWTPLGAASGNGHLEVVQYLFDHGANVDIHTRSEDGYTPLYAASRSGSLKVVRYLLEHGANTDIHVRNKNGLTPLYIASCNGHIEVVKFLFEHGAADDIDAATKGGWTPLNAASDSGHLEVVKYLLRQGDPADIHTPTKTGQTPLYSASVQGHPEVVTYLYEHGAADDIRTTNESNWTALNAASKNGHLEVVKYLLQKVDPADIHTPTKTGQTPLYSASVEGHLKVVEYLFEHGAAADINFTTKGGWTPLNAASESGHLEVVEYLLQKMDPADIHTPTKTGQTPLYSASAEGHLEVVEYLFEHGATGDINATTEEGWTPLGGASVNGHLRVVKYLLKHGADINSYTTNEYSWTSLCAASSQGHSEVVAFLLEKGAKSDIYSNTEDGWTPMHAASRHDHIEITQLLLDAGADVNVRGPRGQTPLICAISYARKEISRLLIRSSADTTLTDNYGRTATDWLRLLNTDDELLKSLCPNPETPIETPPETNMERLKTSITSLRAQILDRQVEYSTGLFSILGHYYLMCNDTENANIAFQQKVEIVAREASTCVQHDLCCDLCSARPIEGSRFICKTCPDTDLCQSCMDEYREGKHFAACRMHEYFEVSGLGSTPMDSDSLRAWLRDEVDQGTLSVTDDDTTPQRHDEGT